MTVRVAQYYPRALTGDGGMTRAIHRLSQTMQAHGADTRIICDAGPLPPPTEGEVCWRSIPHRRIAGRVFPDPAQLARALRGADVLILNSAWTLHNVVAAAVARRLAVPYIIAPRGAYDPRIRGRHRIAKDAWWLAAERHLLGRSLAVHLFFESEWPHLQQLGYRGQVIVAPNGVDVPSDIRWDGGSDRTVLWLGRFDPEHKGIDILLRAIELIPPPDRPRVRLCGPDWRGRKRTVAQLVGQLELGPWVTVAEPIHGREKLELMARASAFVYPSRWEGFGNSVAEAASVGAPVLVTPYPLGRFLASRGAAVMAAPTPAELAAGLTTVLSPAWSDAGARARQVAAECFNWDMVAQRWLQGIDQALANARRRP
ncbi:MAG: glycosyltransferase [Candidatus Dormibacteria bacterium]|jgi:glycosyltransferase involved in cell wall biosynthesis